MCAFHVFGGYRSAQTTKKIEVSEPPKNSFAYKTPAEPPTFSLHRSHNCRRGTVGGVVWRQDLAG